MDARISKAEALSAKLKHLWCQPSISLKLGGRMYCVAVCSILMYGCKTRSLRSDGVRHLEVFDCRCLCNISIIGWSNRVSNMHIVNLELDTDSEDIIPQRVKVSGLRFLRQVLGITKTRLPCRSVFSAEREESHEDQHMR